MPRAIELIEKDFHSIDLREKKNQERVRRLKYRPIPVWEEAILNVQESSFAENTITLPHMQREPTIVENKGKVGQKWRTDFDLKGASHSESMRSNIRVKNLNEESVEITKWIGMQRPAAILHCGLLDGLSGNENKNSKLSSQEIDEVALPLVQFTEVTLPELNNQNGTPNCSFESSHRASNFHDIQHSLRSVEKCETYRNRIVNKSKEDHLESVSNLKSDEQTWNGTERVGGARNAKPTSEAMKQTVKRPFSSVTYRHREQLIPLHLFVSVPQNPTAAKNKDSFTSRSPVPPQGINENPKKSSRENKLNRGRLNLIKSNFSLNFSNLDMKFVTINNPIARTNKRKTNLELRPTLENSVFSWESARLSLNTRRPQSTHG